MQLEVVTVPAPSTHKATVIWLHGLGDSGHGFAPIVPELRMPDDLGIKFVFPHAPIQPVTINGGMEMRSWYDIKSWDMDGRADEQDVRASAEKVEALIEQELAAGISADKIVLAGFSQGGVVTLHLGPRLKHKLAGLMALSTYMCVGEKLTAEKKQTDLPIFMAHGQLDPVVPIQAGQQAKQYLEDNGFQVSWQDYRMEHSVCGEEIIAIKNWLMDRLA